jgi:hypothetical protein
MDRSEIAARVAKTRAACELLRSRMSLCIFSLFLSRRCIRSGVGAELGRPGSSSVRGCEIGGARHGLRHRALAKPRGRSAPAAVVSRGETTKESSNPLDFLRQDAIVAELSLSLRHSRNVLGWDVSVAEMKDCTPGMRGNRATRWFLRFSGKIRQCRASSHPRRPCSRSEAREIWETR